MIRSFSKFLMTSLTVLLLVFCVNTNVLANTIYWTPPEVDHILYPGNVFPLPANVFNVIISDWGITFGDDSFPIENPTEVPIDVELTDLTITDPGLITVVKISSESLIFKTGGLSSFYIHSDKGISSYASVPDASIMWLLGTAFIILGLFGRRKIKV